MASLSTLNQFGVCFNCVILFAMKATNDEMLFKIHVYARDKLLPPSDHKIFSLPCKHLATISRSGRQHEGR